MDAHLSPQRKKVSVEQTFQSSRVVRLSDVLQLWHMSCLNGIKTNGMRKVMHKDYGGLNGAKPLTVIKNHFRRPLHPRDVSMIV